MLEHTDIFAFLCDRCDNNVPSGHGFYLLDTYTHECLCGAAWDLEVVDCTCPTLRVCSECREASMEDREDKEEWEE